MTRIRLQFPSMTLLRLVDISIVLPFGSDLAPPPYRVVWGLHCAMETGEFFFDSLNAKALAGEINAAFVAPSLGNGWFTNNGFERQADFLRELVEGLPDILPLARGRDNNAVIGVSMGGFGAVNLAMTGDFCSAAAISGIFTPLVDPDWQINDSRHQKTLHRLFARQMRDIFLEDGKILRSQCDIAHLLVTNSTAETRLALYCGTDDALAWPQTRWLADICNGTGIKAELCELPGAHDQNFWQKAFRLAMHSAFGQHIPETADV